MKILLTMVVVYVLKNARSAQTLGKKHVWVGNETKRELGGLKFAATWLSRSVNLNIAQFF